MANAITASLAALAIGLLGCDDPFEVKWAAFPDTVLLYSLARPELNLPSAFSFNPRGPVRVETPGASGTWDIALDTRDARLVFLPPAALGINSRARITTLPGMRFDDVREAPTDTSVYVSNAPVQVSAGTIYVVQTREIISAFGSRCVYYAKLEPLTIDVAGGTLEFVYDTNPVCNDARLVPPEG